MAKALTDAAVKAVKGGKARREIADTYAQGLYLIVQPSGKKSWALRYRRPNGQPAKLTLGPVDFTGEEPADPTTLALGTPLSLQAARVVAAEQMRQRAKGIDPAARHVAEKRCLAQATEDAAANTFPALATRFVNEHKVRRTGARPRRWRAIARYLGLAYGADSEAPTLIVKGLADRWSARAVTSIDGNDLYGVVNEVRRTGVPGLPKGYRHDAKGLSDTQGQAMAAVLSTLFSWLLEHRHIGANPALGMHKPLAPRARDRVLNTKPDVRRADEVRWFWQATGKLTQPFEVLLKLLLLTGCRRDELAEMRWDELSDDMATLRLPGSRTKNGRPHTVHLAPVARDLLTGMPRIAGCPYVFTTNGKTPVSGFSVMKKTLDTAMLDIAHAERPDAVIPPWRVHDLRRTCATSMADIGVLPHVIEAVLNHVSGSKGGIAGVYNLAAYEAETKEAWNRWALRLQTLLADNVIPLPRQGGAA
jgi:integrase